MDNKNKMIFNCILKDLMNNYFFLRYIITYNKNTSYILGLHDEKLKLLKKN